MKDFDGFTKNAREKYNREDYPYGYRKDKKYVARIELKEVAKMKNGEIWQDVKGNDIQAHGGCIMQFEGKFYWYGEHKGIDNTPGQRRTDVIGVSCYSSDDLLNWTYEGLALSAENDEKSMLNPKKRFGAPKGYL